MLHHKVGMGHGRRLQVSAGCRSIVGLHGIGKTCRCDQRKPATAMLLDLKPAVRAVENDDA